MKQASPLFYFFSFFEFVGNVSPSSDTRVTIGNKTSEKKKDREILVNFLFFSFFFCNGRRVSRRLALTYLSLGKSPSKIRRQFRERGGVILSTHMSFSFPRDSLTQFLVERQLEIARGFYRQDLIYSHGSLSASAAGPDWTLGNCGETAVVTQMALRFLQRNVIVVLFYPPPASLAFLFPLASLCVYHC